MKKISIFLILAGLIYFTGCTKKDEKTETTNKPVETTTPPSTTPVPTQTEKKEEPVKTVEEKKAPEKKENNTKDKSAPVRVNFPEGVNELLLNGFINGFNEKFTYVLKVKKGQFMVARVMTTDLQKYPNPNIRIAQIKSPSGKVEGPYGVKIKYDFDEEGDWQIVVDENQTNGKPWKGEYILKLNLN